MSIPVTATTDSKDVVVEEREEVDRKQVAQLDFSEHAMATMPASLRELSQEERDRMHKKVVRKIDLVVMPIIMIVYILNFIDRQNLAAAKLQGILEDLHMNTEQFATSIALFNVGYLPFQIPSNLLITRVSRPGLYICSAVSIWGLISGCTAAVQSYHALLGLRVLLGAAEAVFFPGVIYYLSAWYTKKEIGKRIAIFFIGQELGNAFGGLIGASTVKLDGHHGLSAWRWLFIIEGSATVFLGIFFALVMPEFPHNTRTLTPVERDMAVWRIEREAGAAEAHEEDRLKKGIMLLVKDVKLWILTWMSFLTHALGSITTFFPTIVNTLGYSPTNTLLLTAPPYILACFYFFGLSWTSDRYNSIYWQVQVCNALAIIVCIIPLATLSVGGRYTAMMLMPSATVCPQIFIYKTANLHMSRPASKRALAAAFINSIGSVAAYWCAYIFIDPPGLHPAFFTLLAISVMFLLTMFGYRWLVRRENRRLNGSEEEVRKAMKGGVTQEQVDMGWRYECY